jgi:hypothetical protein
MDGVHGSPSLLGSLLQMLLIGTLGGDDHDLHVEWLVVNDTFETGV